ncbi:MAG: hypothetical protein GX556_18575 [Fibrobacter sp.]|nr:hypothetical protein [Fibrobacter sp.]
MKKDRIVNVKTVTLTSIIFMSLASICTAQTLIDFFQPMPIVKPLRSNVWGSSVGKRDIGNGMEDTTNRSYSYWDGPIIKGPDGKYHMFASRWNQSGGHWAWLSSVGIHAVSDNIMGPYIDKGLTWPNNSGGKGHNLTILQLKDGTYASVVSDTRPGDFFTAPSLDGPWSFAGSIKIEANGFNKPGHIANLSIIIRPDDGKFMVIERNGQIMTSDNLTGPYKVQCNSIYSGLAPNLEDPVLWYSGGYYHVVVNSWSDKKAFHLRSRDGIRNWTNEGTAFDPRSNFLRYTDGTVNHWTKIERPGVYIEDGHITHWTFSVIDCEKENDGGNDSHNSKVIIVPFDGVSFDGVAIPPQRDTVYNGKFNTGKIGWSLNVWSGSATGDVVEGEYKVTVSGIGENVHDIQLVQTGLILEQGKYYQVSFDAYAASNRTLDVNVEMEDDPWTSYLQALKTFDITTSKTPYSFTFKMEQPTDSSSRLGFNFGASTGTVYLDNIIIQQATGTSFVPSVSRRISFKPDVSYKNSSLRIKYQTDPGSQLSLDLFDLRGNIVDSRILQSGSGHIWTLDLSGLPGGTYVAGLKADGMLINSTKFICRN